MVESHGWSELGAGDRFAGYRIEQRLGRGGMGILYLAIEPGLDRRVALKLIAPEAAAEEVFARRFAEESRIAASIEHPNVVPIYAAGEEDGVPFIAMRYVAGSDLGRRLAREGRLEPAVAAALIAQIGNGLDAIHAAGLVHRDVKPANVLLSAGQGEDHAYITDFGVARNVATESGLTQTGRFVGTLDYVAPEQISGGAVDARADVYALGCLLFKLLTGEVPFPREAEAARLYAHLNDPPPAPSLYAPGVSMALDDVVARALSKQPGDRYPSAGDLGRAALAAARGDAVAAPERTVATGAAATRERPSPPARLGEGSAGPSAPTVASAPEATAATGRIEPPSRSPRLDRGRWIAVVLGAFALIVLAVFTLPALVGMVDGNGENPSFREAVALQKEQESQPQTLTRAQLIRRADAVCAESQRRYVAIRDMESENSVDVPYAEALVRNARQRVRGLRALEPPAGLAGPYGEYVAAQERVLATDEQALAAAREEDAAGVEAARASRDGEDALREDLAGQIGFTVCSVPQS